MSTSTYVKVCSFPPSNWQPGVNRTMLSPASAGVWMVRLVGVNGYHGLVGLAVRCAAVAFVRIDRIKSIINEERKQVCKVSIP
jgi:hypothetical protein